MWGYSSGFQLGNGGEGNADFGNTLKCQTTPIKVMDDVKSVSMGLFHTVALKNDRTLWAWGSNSEGQLANGGVGDKVQGQFVTQTVPMQVAEDVVSADACWLNTAFVKSDGSLWTCRDNIWGMLGNGKAGSNPMDAEGNIVYQSTPIKVLDNIKCVQVGGAMVAAVDKNDALWTWGYNSFHQLGFGEGGDVSDPASGTVYQSISQKVMDNVQAVSPGSCDCLVVDMDGRVWMWGLNSYHQTEDKIEVDEEGRIIIELPRFSDVANDAYYAQAVKWAVENGITQGISETGFGPTENCTRGQIVTFLYRDMGE